MAASEHEWRDCFHPTTQHGGDGCHFFMRCHGIWPERCDLSERDHRERDAEKIERLLALLAERDAEIKELVEAGNKMNEALMTSAKVILDSCKKSVTVDQLRAYQDRAGESMDAWRAALAARGGEVQG